MERTSVKATLLAEDVLNFSKKGNQALPTMNPVKIFGQFRIYSNKFFKLVYIMREEQTVIFDFVDLFYAMYKILFGMEVKGISDPKFYWVHTGPNRYRLQYGRYFIGNLFHTDVQNFIDETKLIFKSHMFQCARDCGIYDFRSGILDEIFAKFPVRLRKWRNFQYVYDTIKSISSGILYEHFEFCSERLIVYLCTFLTLL